MNPLDKVIEILECIPKEHLYYSVSAGPVYITDTKPKESMITSTTLPKLMTAHIDLRVLFTEVAKTWDITVLEGYRPKEAQDKAVAEGKSKTPWPTSRHNSNPSMAVDAIPNRGGIDWNDRERMSYFAGYVKATADKLLQEGKISHTVCWGGDWDSDTEVKDNSFDDLVHFELVG